MALRGDTGVYERKNTCITGASGLPSSRRKGAHWEEKRGRGEKERMERGDRRIGVVEAADNVCGHK